MLNFVSAAAVLFKNFFAYGEIVFKYYAHCTVFLDFFSGK